MNAKILLDELQSQSILTRELSAEVLRDANISKKQAEDIIYERQLVPSEEIAKLKSRLLKVPYKKIQVDAIPAELLKLIPEETVFSYKVVPLSKTPELLVVGMLYPDDLKAQEVLRFIAKREKVNLGIYLISRKDFDLVMRRYNPFSDEIREAMQFVRPQSGESAATGARRTVKLDEGSTITDEMPIIKIVASTLKEAVLAKASDIHIEPQRNRLRVRFRIDGDLKEVLSLPAELQQPIISRVKVLSELLIDETRRPQDGRFRTVISGRDIDFRVASFPTPLGEKIALRVLDPSIGLKSLTDLGFSGHNLDILNKGLERPFGMILFTGPTGSGKTTALYAIMQTLNKEDVNIVSLEDPVEYFIDGMNQSQVRHDIGYTFASGLRQILRQDPDIIMIGEIRDSETAELAVHAALTGHIVLSTLHTNNAIGVVPRLIDMKVDSFLLPPALNLMAAQRLLPQLCNYCKEASDPPEEMLKLIEKTIAEAGPDVKSAVKKPYKIYHSAGCAKCNGKGYSGRLAIREIFQMTKELSDIIASRAVSEPKIIEEAKRQGMITLREDGVVKALNGSLAMEVVLRETAD